MSNTRILYNHECAICRAEITHYRARADAAHAPVVFEDLNDTDLTDWTLTPDQAKRRLHAILPDGTKVSGIDAFAAIWCNLPGLTWAARLVSLPVVRQVASFGYNRVAAPWLYRKQQRREAGQLADHGARP